MLKHLDYITHFDNLEDRDILTRKLFDVNIRLFNSSEEYRKIVLQACDYIKWCSSTEKVGYKKPHGFSGANAGIPFNIIAFNINNITTALINPKILEYKGEVIESLSNCGSLTLEEPIPVHRKSIIIIEYYDMAGEKQKAVLSRTQGGLTVQHEVDHNNGILIFDRSPVGWPEKHKNWKDSLDLL